jgi:hypothetical protein
MANETAKKPMLEQHYTIAELAQRWGFSVKFIRLHFQNEPGVIVVQRPESMHKRGYATMRIPESVAERVYARLVKKPTSPAAARLREVGKLA